MANSWRIVYKVTTPVVVWCSASSFFCFMHAIVYLCNMSADSSISINKFISSRGLCSRREADRWIDAGRVRLNGKVANKGNRVYPGDKVTVDGRTLQNAAEPVYLALHKPAGITSTTDPSDPTNIIRFVNYPERLFPIGRLDKESTGLILLTNDGDMVNKILRAENKKEKEYVVTVDKPVTEEFIRKMAGGIPMLGTVTRKCVVEQTGPMTFRIVLIQGLNRQIRRMCEYLDYQVVKLKRTRIMHLNLRHLPEGQWRELTEEEVRAMKAMTSG